MITVDNIKVIQVEISNYCNLACPQCPRNYFGGKVLDTLPLKCWTLDEFKHVFSNVNFDSLEQVYFCGTYGDPLSNKEIVKMCEFLRQKKSTLNIGIHTNGSIGSSQLYKKLAPIVNFIAFGIDGLKDTNHIYRRHAKWDLLIKNVKVFIESGGYAIWDFIVFKHNQHQLDDARQQSIELGFKEFNIKKTSRFFQRNHVLADKLAVYSKQNKFEYFIEAPTIENYINKGYTAIKFFAKKNLSIKDFAHNTKINCNSQRISEIYIGAEGFVFNCGWLHDRLYGPEIENHADHKIINNLIEQAGGQSSINIFSNNLKDIVKNWFGIIEQNWAGTNRLERCGIICGSGIGLITSQNEEIHYKL